MKNIADSAKIEIKEYNIIYDVVDDVTNAINGMLSIKYEENISEMLRLGFYSSFQLPEKLPEVMSKMAKLSEMQSQKLCVTAKKSEALTVDL